MIGLLPTTTIFLATALLIGLTNGTLASASDTCTV